MYSLQPGFLYKLFARVTIETIKELISITCRSDIITRSHKSPAYFYLMSFALGHGSSKATKKETKQYYEKEVIWGDGEEGVIKSTIGPIQFIAYKSHVSLSAYFFSFYSLYVPLMSFFEGIGTRHIIQGRTITACFSVSFETCRKANEAEKFIAYLSNQKKFKLVEINSCRIYIAASRRVWKIWRFMLNREQFVKAQTGLQLTFMFLFARTLRLYQLQKICCLFKKKNQTLQSRASFAIFEKSIFCCAIWRKYKLFTAQKNCWLQLHLDAKQLWRVLQRRQCYPFLHFWQKFWLLVYAQRWASTQFFGSNQYIRYRSKSPSF